MDKIDIDRILSMRDMPEPESDQPQPVIITRQRSAEVIGLIVRKSSVPGVWNVFDSKDGYGLGSFWAGENAPWAGAAIDAVEWHYRRKEGREFRVRIEGSEKKEEKKEEGKE